MKIANLATCCCTSKTGSRTIIAADRQQAWVNFVTKFQCKILEPASYLALKIYHNIPVSQGVYNWLTVIVPHYCNTL